jgi:adenylate kinase family enzyme
MVVKLFVLGLPGSGKSSVARIIATYARNGQWSTTHISDYAILYEMFQEDTQGQFKSTLNGGFDVLDLAVIDTALRKLEQKVKAHVSTAKLEEIVLIEFSRNDYQRAFQQFSDTFLHDAYFLYLGVDLETCKRRIRERTANPNTTDDFYVSEYIFNTYYNKDDGQDIPQILARDYGIDTLRIKVIENNGSLDDIVEEIYEYVDRIGELENFRGS